MNWREAVEVMRSGREVRRKAWMLPGRLLYVEGRVSVYEDRGREGMRLAAAWTDDNKPVMVFCGAGSGVLFVPDDADMDADDWAVVDEPGGRDVR